MERIKLYITHFLLAGFLFPQVANAVHYLLEPHLLTSYQGETYDIGKLTYDYHVCDYQFNSLKYNITQEVIIKPPFFVPREKEEDYYRIKFVNKLAFHYSLRGPPTRTDFTEEQNLFI